MQGLLLQFLGSAGELTVLPSGQVVARAPVLVELWLTALLRVIVIRSNVLVDRLLELDKVLAFTDFSSRVLRGDLQFD